jgi:hypothetical protein
MHVANHLFLGTFRTEDCLSIPFWKGAPFGDSVLLVVLPPVITGSCFNLAVSCFFWQSVLVWAPLPILVLLRNPSVFYGLSLSLIAFLVTPTEMLQGGSGPTNGHSDSNFASWSTTMPLWLGIHISWTLLCLLSSMRDWWQSQTSFELIW